MSLRARLVWSTAILIAAGLTVSGITTYLLVRNSLVSRVDEQLEAARPLAAQLLQSEGSSPLYPSRRGGSPRGPGLPSTFVMLLDPSGDVVATRTVGLRSIPSPPVLPTQLPGARNAGGTDSLFFTAQDPERSSTFRALAFRHPGEGGTVVVAQPLDDVHATISRLLLIEGFVGLGVMTAAIATALWLIRLNLQPLSRMERTAADIAAGDLSRRVDTDSPDTEVGRLGQALNAMLEKIENAFQQRRKSEDKLRRFVADASHELRTPLTSIRGYAELFRSGASSNPDDLAKSMRRIEEESARMARLVEEMFLLARLDQDPQLNMDELDLGAVAGDVVNDARTVHPDTPIKLTVDEGVVVAGDDTRLRQVVSNLLANACKHSPPGTVVAVTVARRGAEAVLEVCDHGPGLEPEQAEKVFDRFFRVDKARTRNDGGAGLGLAIVAAIVEAHGGRVWVETSPGAGSTFSVALKLAAPRA